MNQAANLRGARVGRLLPASGAHLRAARWLAMTWERVSRPAPAFFAGTPRPSGLVLFASRAPFPEKRREIPTHGKVETGFFLNIFDAGAWEKSRGPSCRRRFESFFAIFASAATHGVTQKPTAMTNQGLRHDWL